MTFFLMWTFLASTFYTWIFLAQRYVLTSFFYNHLPSLFNSFSETFPCEQHIDFPIILKLFLKVLSWSFYFNDNENSNKNFLMTLICFLLSLAEHAKYVYKMFFWKNFFNCFKTWISASNIFGNHCSFSNATVATSYKR